MTRAVHALLRGNVAGAFGANVLFPFFLGAIAVGWLAWVRSALGLAPVRLLTRLQPRSGAVAAAAARRFRRAAQPVAVRRARA